MEAPLQVDRPREVGKKKKKTSKLSLGDNYSRFSCITLPSSNQTNHRLPPTPFSPSQLQAEVQGNSDDLNANPAAYLFQGATPETRDVTESATLQLSKSSSATHSGETYSKGVLWLHMMSTV